MGGTRVITVKGVYSQTLCLCRSSHRRWTLGSGMTGLGMRVAVGWSGYESVSCLGNTVMGSKSRTVNITTVNITTIVRL